MIVKNFPNAILVVTEGYQIAWQEKSSHLHTFSFIRLENRSMDKPSSRYHLSIVKRHFPM